MPRYNPFTLQMQLTRMYRDGQSFFAKIKLQEWLKERNEDPANYEIILREQPAPPGAKEAMTIAVDLCRLDGQPVDPWLLQEINRSQ
jgi:hypothetical protein